MPVSETTVHTTTPPIQAISTFGKDTTITTFIPQPTGFTVAGFRSTPVCIGNTTSTTWTDQNQRARKKTQHPICVSPRLRQMWNTCTTTTTCSIIHEPYVGRQFAIPPRISSPRFNHQQFCNEEESLHTSGQYSTISKPHSISMHREHDLIKSTFRVSSQVNVHSIVSNSSMMQENNTLQRHNPRIQYIDT